MAPRLCGIVDRRLGATVRTRLSGFPVVVLAGARAVGKSVLLRQLADEAGVIIVDLDDLDTRALALADPATFASGPAPVCIDEFQHVPEILDAIRAELNRRSAPGRFLLTGSTRYETLPRATQCLTGRATVVPVWPLSQGEIDGVHEDFVERLLSGEAPARAGSCGRTSARSTQNACWPAASRKPWPCPIRYGPSGSPTTWLWCASATSWPSHGCGSEPSCPGC